MLPPRLEPSGPSTESRDPRGVLLEALGVEFERPELLEEALTHRSYCNENPKLAPRDNERLEFLGDAVVGLAVASLLHEHFPLAAEGELTRRRADLVCERGLTELAEELEIGAALRLGKGELRSGGREKPRLLSSALEAILGAVCVDAGVAKAYDLARRLFEPRLHAVTPGETDFKSRLQERAQAERGETPRYQVEASEGPDHDRVFAVTVSLGGEVSGRGRGGSKLRAEQEAARLALENWPAPSVPEGEP
jgi:ribonuclease III